MLYLAGLVVLDLAVLALGAGMIATMDLDKAGTLGVLATVPVVLLVLSDFPVAHVALRMPAETDPGTRRSDRRITTLLASGLTAAGAVPLLVVTVAVEGPVLLAGGCIVLAALALAYSFVVGDLVARRRAARERRAVVPTLVPRRSVLRGGLPGAVVIPDGPTTRWTPARGRSAAVPRPRRR